jgi:P4 family phage/plasmid primase-like protien
LYYLKKIALGVYMLKNFVVPSLNTPLSKHHIEATELLAKIKHHDDSEAYHCLFDLEPRDDYKGYDGLHYPASGWVIIDIDFNEPSVNENITKSLVVVKKVIHSLELSESFARVFFSGNKGFHVYIRAEFFNINTPTKTCAKEIKEIVKTLAKKFNFPYDSSVYHANRKFRLPSSLNPKSNLYKTELDFYEVATLTPEQIIHKAASPSVTTIESYDVPTKKYTDYIEVSVAGTEVRGFFGGEILDDSTADKFKKHKAKVCIERMESTPIDKEDANVTRHDVMLAIISDFVNTGVPRDEAEDRIEKFLTLNGISERFENQGLYAIREAYTKGSKYYEGCYADVKKAFCSGTCELYKKLNREKRATVSDLPPENVVINSEPRKNDDLFYLKDGTSLKHSDLSTELAESCKDSVLLDADRDLFYVFNKVWRQTSEAEIKKVVFMTMIKATARTGFNSTVFTASFTLLKVIIGRSNLHWEVNGILPLENGILNLKTKQLEDFSNTRKVNFILPYNYDQTATCPLFDQLIEFLSEGKKEKRDVLLCYLAALVRGMCQLEKYLELVGTAGAGKSSYMEVACALVGHKNVFTSQLRMLAGNRFETAGLYEKRLAIFPDEKDHLAEGTDIFKAMIGQDTIRYEQKNKQQLEGFKFTGMVIVSCNSPMTFEDHSHAIPRRRITVHIDAVLSEDKKDPDFKKNLVAEIPGVLNKLVDISEDEIKTVLMNKNHGLDESNRRSLVETNPIYEWFDTKIILNESGKLYVGGVLDAEDRINPTSYAEYVNRDFMYPDYLSWCRNMGIQRPVTVKKFSNLIRGIIDVHSLPVVRVKRTEKGWLYRGISLRFDENSQDLTPITKSRIE